MERDKCPLAKTKTLSLLLCQHWATTVPEPAAREREDGQELDILPIYISGLTIGRNSCDGKIKGEKFRERLGEAKEFPEQQYDKEGDKNTL